jgi:hypothetical protein
MTNLSCLPLSSFDTEDELSLFAYLTVALGLVSVLLVDGMWLTSLSHHEVVDRGWQSEHSSLFILFSYLPSKVRAA